MSDEASFARLASSYEHALQTADCLEKSGILKQSIKTKGIFVDEDESYRKELELSSILAEDFRTHDKQYLTSIGGRGVIADCFFYDLDRLGNEWEFAKFKSKFTQWKNESVKFDEDN